MQDERISTASCEFQTSHLSNPLSSILDGNGVFVDVPAHTAEDDE
jgi:hypothetical protein